MARSLRKKRGERLPADIAMLLRPPTPAAVIRRISRQTALDWRLVPTDRHMQRWAVGEGTGLPNEDRALYPKSVMPPLPASEAIITDQVVLEAPTYWRRFIVLWYRSDCSVDQLSAELQMSRDKVFIERRLVLAYLLGRLLGAGLRISTWEPGA